MAFEKMAIVSTYKIILFFK